MTKNSEVEVALTVDTPKLEKADVRTFYEECEPIIGGYRPNITPPFRYLDSIRSGVPRERVDEIAGILGFTDKEMAKVLTVSERTLHRMAKQLDSNQTERLLLLESLIEHGLDVFDEKKNVLLRWLREPRPSLGNISPISILDTIVGFRLVDGELTRIEEGAVS